MSTAEPLVWRSLPVLSQAQAQSFNRLAAHCGFGGRSLELLGVPCAVCWRPSLPRYPVSFHLRTDAGRVRIGCDLGALWPELAAGGLRALLEAQRQAADPEGLALLGFLLGEWIDRLEQVLGQTVTLQCVRFDEAWPRMHWALRVDDAVQGRSGTVAFAGQSLQHALGALDDDGPPMPQRHARFAQVPVALAWRVAAPTLALHRLATLVEHAVLLLDDQPAELCVVARHGRLCIRGFARQEGFMVSGVDLKTDDHFEAHPAASGLVPIDMIMASIDVVLDTLVMPLSDIVALAPGSVLGLAQLQTGRAVTLRCNGAPFARGEVIAVGQRLGVLITQKAGVVESPPAPGGEAAAEAPAPRPRRRAAPRRTSAPAAEPDVFDDDEDEDDPDGPP